MKKVILPFLFLFIATGLLFSYTLPAYDAMQAYRELDTKTNEVLSKSKEVNAIYGELLQKSLAIPDNDLVRINRLLPETFDSLLYFIQIDRLAFKYGLNMRSFVFPKEEVKTNPKTDKGGVKAETALAPIPKIFTVEFVGEYSNVAPFLRDIEQTLALTDIDSFMITVNVSDGKDGKIKGAKVYIISVVLRTYVFPKNA